MEVFKKYSGILSEEREARLYAWEQDGLTLSLQEETVYGVVHEGDANVETPEGTFPLSTGMYFSLSGNVKITSKGSTPSKGVIFLKKQYKGLFMLGGPMEEQGRLRYINGCTDTLLIPPTLLGDPCLNLLHIPAHTAQTQHTHPSLRYGVILSGNGTCHTPLKEFPLYPGLIFHIPENTLHSFHTQEEDLRVVAWHPDSDMGPTHENHPMINKTIIPS